MNSMWSLIMAEEYRRRELLHQLGQERLVRQYSPSSRTTLRPAALLAVCVLAAVLVLSALLLTGCSATLGATRTWWRNLIR